MVALYMEVKRHQPNVNVIRSKTVAFQGTLYLMTIYWIAVPVIGTAIVPIDWIYFYVFAVINFQIFGLWVIPMYLYFTIPRSNNKNKIDSISEGEATARTTAAATLTKIIIISRIFRIQHRKHFRTTFQAEEDRRRRH